MQINRTCTIVLAAFTLVAATLPLAARDLMIYSGEPLSANQITLSAWGSGSASEDSTEGFSGNRSISVKTAGLYSGAFFHFADPIEIADPAQVSKYDYFELVIKFTALTPMGLNSPNKAVNATGEYRPLPYDYYSDEYYDEMPMVPKARKLRLMVTSADGKSVGYTGPIVPYATDEEGWYKVALPLKPFGLLDTKGFRMSKLAIGADYAGDFKIGQFRIVTDDTPIYVESMGDLQPASSDIIILRGRAEAGITPLAYSWDFNSSDGVQEDASGEFVDVQYKKSGTYTVTLTAKDPAGIKAPSSATVEIQVE